MFQVDVYLRVRRSVMVEGMSIREASRVLSLHRDTVRKMLAYSVPLGTGDRPSKEDQTFDKLRWSPTPASYTGFWRRPEASEEAAPHRQAYLPAAPRRVRVRRGIHYGQGLREGASAADAGRFLRLSPILEPRPVRLRRSPADHWPIGEAGPKLSSGLAPQRRMLHQGLPG